MLKGMTSQRLIALSMTGIVFLNFPLLSLWDKAIYVLGWPILPFGLFLLWGILIAALAWVMEKRNTN
ncbi:hypothetical protein [Colwellia psychrerythraea]|uniref:hypothetical protein n=1 Tax=Colwellia psychrerythraea TaxID=28229 RepID=UPI0006906DB5|nr:hypothetical protein [Colwellia psychrerythraea]